MYSCCRYLSYRSWSASPLVCAHAYDLIPVVLKLREVTDNGVGHIHALVDHVVSSTQWTLLWLPCGSTLWTINVFLSFCMYVMSPFWAERRCADIDKCPLLTAFFLSIFSLLNLHRSIGELEETQWNWTEIRGNSRELKGTQGNLRETQQK